MCYGGGFVGPMPGCVFGPMPRLCVWSDAEAVCLVRCQGCVFGPMPRLCVWSDAEAVCLVRCQGCVFGLMPHVCVSDPVCTLYAKVVVFVWTCL